jgi:hypothetical protein
VRAKTIAAGLAAAAIAVLCLPAGALARGRLVQFAGPGTGPSGRGTKKNGRFTMLTQELKLHGSNGYAVDVTLEDRHRLEVDASSTDFKAGSFSDVQYAIDAPQRPGSDDIKARIGSLGRIDLHFVAEKTKKPKPLCKGGDLTVETGHYVGSLSFHGDGGFTHVSAHRVAGTVGRETLESCSLTKPAKDPKTERGEAETVPKPEREEAAKQAEERRELRLIALLDGGRVTFAATRMEAEMKNEPTTVSELIVLAERTRGGLREISFLGEVERAVTAFESPDPARPTTEAIIAPSSPPFSGSAVFQSEPKGTEDWTGDLKVRLPGMGTVPLTGAGAKATLCSGGCQGAPSNPSLGPGSSVLG